MRRSTLCLIALFCATPHLLAHEGHGLVESTHPLHLFEPLHLVGLTAALLALAALIVVRRNQARRV